MFKQQCGSIPLLFAQNSPRLCIFPSHSIQANNPDKATMKNGRKSEGSLEVGLFYNKLPSSTFFFSRITLRPRPLSSLHSTSNATGMPASSLCVPFTMLS